MIISCIPSVENSTPSQTIKLLEFGSQLLHILIMLRMRDPPLAITGSHLVTIRLIGWNLIHGVFKQGIILNSPKLVEKSRQADLCRGDSLSASL